MAGSQCPHAMLPVLLVLLLSLGNHGAEGRSLSAPARPERLSGRAIVIAEEGRDGSDRMLLAVHTSDNQLVPVHVDDESKLAGVTTGMHVELKGSWAAAPSLARGGAANAGAALGAPAAPRRFSAASISASGGPAAASKGPQLTVEPSRGPAGAAAGAGLASAAAGRPTAAAATLSTNTLVTSELSVLVVPITASTKAGAACAGTERQTVTVADIKKAVFQELNPEGSTLGGTYASCSYGKTRLTQANSAVAAPVDIGCAGNTDGLAWKFGQCEMLDYEGWASAADKVLASRGVQLANYKYKIYLIPSTDCPWLGLGYVGCDGSYDCRAWIGPGFWDSAEAMAHELGHNLYLAHAGANERGEFAAYADETCFMGGCCAERCPNTPHAWQLGWISVQQLDSSSLGRGATVAASLAAQSAGPNKAGIRVVADWAAGSVPLFVGLRTRGGKGDAGLSVEAAGKVHIYTSPIQNTYSSEYTTWRASLAAGQAWTQPGTGVVVRVRSINKGVAAVTVCRRAGAETADSCRAGLDNDCNGLVGAADSACASLLASPTPSKRLQPPNPPAPSAKQAAGASRMPPPRAKRTLRRR